MEQTSSELLQYLDNLVEKLREHTPRSIEAGEIEAIHEARVATRRLKAAMELFAPIIQAKRARPLGRIGKKLRRRLGPLRDADVMLEHLRAIDSAVHASAVAWAISRLEAARNAAQTKMAADLSAADVLTRLGSWWGLHSEIAAHLDIAGDLLTRAVHLQVDGFAEQARLLDSHHREPGTSATRQDPHQLRITGKSLRYTLEIAKAHGHLLKKQLLARFKFMQEKLGLWHDYVVLTERLLSESTADLLAHHDAVLQRGVLNLASHTLRKATLELNRLLAYWNKNGDGIVEQIRGAFPITVPAEATVDSVEVTSAHAPAVVGQ